MRLKICQLRLAREPDESCRLMNNFRLNPALVHYDLIDCTVHMGTALAYIDRKLDLNDCRENNEARREPVWILLRIDSAIEIERSRYFAAIVVATEIAVATEIVAATAIAAGVDVEMNNFPSVQSCSKGSWGTSGTDMEWWRTAVVVPERMCLDWASSVESKVVEHQDCRCLSRWGSECWMVALGTFESAFEWCGSGLMSLACLCDMCGKSSGVFGGCGDFW